MSIFRKVKGFDGNDEGDGGDSGSQSAWVDGYTAYPNKHCDLEDGSTDHDLWLEGWNSARNDKETSKLVDEMFPGLAGDPGTGIVMAKDKASNSWGFCKVISSSRTPREED